MLEPRLAFLRANTGINKEARLFCNGFGRHPDHILQQLQTSISYFELETAASWPLDMELAIKDYTHLRLRLHPFYLGHCDQFFPLILPFVGRKFRFHGNDAQTTIDTVSKAPNCSNHSPIAWARVELRLCLNLCQFSSVQTVFGGGWLPGRVNH